MLEIMTGIGAGGVPQPTGDIQGIVQNMGVITGLPTTSSGAVECVARDNKVYFGYGSTSSAIYVLDLLTNTVSQPFNDFTNTITGRLATLDSSGQYFTLLAGSPSGNPSVKMQDVLNNTLVRNTGSAGINFVTEAGHGVYNFNNYVVGAYSNVSTIRKIYIPTSGTVTTTTLSPTVAASSAGYSSCIVGNNLYTKAKNGSQLYKFDMVNETLTSLPTSNFPSYCNGVYDGTRYIYFIQGTNSAAMVGVRRFDTIANTWDSGYAVKNLVGAKPTTASYNTYTLRLGWYNNAIYFFRSDLSTTEGKTLYRII